MSANEGLALNSPARIAFARRGPIHALGLALIWLIVAFMLATISATATFFLRQLAGDRFNEGVSSPWLYLVSLVVFSLVLLGVSLHMARVLGNGDAAAALGQKNLRRPWLILAITVAMMVAAEAVTWLFERSETRALHHLLFEHPEIWGVPIRRWLFPVCLGLVTIIVAPVAEELFFRGWLWEELRRSWGRPAVALATGLLFLLAHGMGGFVILVCAVPGAVGLSFVRAMDGSVRASLLCHVLYNAGAFAYAYLD